MSPRSAIILLHAAKKFKGDGWIQYDHNVQKRAAAGAIQK